MTLTPVSIFESRKSLATVLVSVAAIALATSGSIWPRQIKHQLASVKSDKQKCEQEGEECWALTQESYQTGQWLIRLSRNGLVAKNRKTGSTIFTSSPDWNLVMYNDQTKLYFSSPLSEWRTSASNLSVQRRGSAISEANPITLTNEAILAYKSYLLLMSISMLGDYKNFDFSLAPQSNPSISNQQRFEQNYGAPVANLGGIPLSVSAIGENGKRFPICQTLSIGRDRIPPSYFSVPANYKRADSEVAVMMDKKGLDTMKEIMADLGDEDPKEIENLLEDKKGDADQSNGSVGSISQK